MDGFQGQGTAQTTHPLLAAFAIVSGFFRLDPIRKKPGSLFYHAIWTRNRIPLRSKCSESKAHRVIWGKRIEKEPAPRKPIRFQSTHKK
jgi:hypothetical protein